MMRVSTSLPRQIGGVDEYRDADGIRYEIRYLVDSSEIDSFLPEIGSRADWAGKNAYVTKIVKTFLSRDVWSVLICAEYLEDENCLIAIGAAEGGMESVTEQAFDVAAIYFPPEWFGCRIAGLADCTPFTDSAKERLPDGKIKYRNIHGEWAHPGDFIAVNAEPLFYIPDSTERAQNASTGTLDFERSPFRGRIPEDWIGQTISTRIYRCVFHVKKNIRKISGFSGISGSFGNKCAPDRIGAGLWKAQSQRVRSVTASGGKIYTRVERTVIEAPGSLTWDQAKNGGTWSW